MIRMPGQGFTLVEMMVTVAITLVLSTALLFGANSYLAKEKVTQATIELVSYLNSIRELAITSQSPAGFKLDYIGVTLSANGIIKAYPVNIGGTGAVYFTKSISTSPIVTTPINFGGLLFAAGSGKLLAKNAGNFGSTPLASNIGVGISVSIAESSDVRTIFISPFGAVTKN